MEHQSISVAIPLIIFVISVLRTQRARARKSQQTGQGQITQRGRSQQQAPRPQPSGRDTPPPVTRVEGDEALLHAEATNPETAHERLAVLATDARFAADVTANPSCPGAVLDRLSSSWNTEATFAIIRNANVLPHTLLKLGHLSPSAFFANPVSTLMLLDKPDLPLRCSLDNVLPLVRHADASPGLLSILSNHSASLVADEARMHVNLSGEVAPERLDDELLRSLLTWQAWPMYGLTQLVQAAELHLIPSWLIAPFVLHGSDSLRRAIARGTDRRCSTIALFRRAGARADLVGYAPPDPTLPADLLDLLARSAPWGRRLAARHPATLPAVLLRLAGDRTPEVRRLAARNPELPATGLASLAGDPHRVIRIEVAYNERTPRHALERLARDTEGSVRAAVAANQSSSAEIVAMLAADAEWQVRRAAARHTAIDADTLRALACDPHPLVRVEVAKRGDVAPECVAALLDDPHPAVRGAATRAMATDGVSPREQKRGETSAQRTPPPGPPGELEAKPPRRAGRGQRPRHTGHTTTLSVVATPTVVTDLLATLVAPGWPNQTMHAASQAMHAIALAHPQVSAAPREKLGRTGSWVERCAVARNPAASDAVLALLSQDTNRIARAMAREAQALRVKEGCA